MLRTSVLSVLLAVSIPAFAQVDLDNVDLNDLLNLKVQSASKQAEPWAEAPVPVSVITKDMIKMAGARNLHEALILLYPVTPMPKTATKWSSHRAGSSLRRTKKS